MLSWLNKSLYFFLVALLVIILYWARNKGFDISDEGYYMNLYSTANNSSFSISSFHLIQKTFLSFVQPTIVNLRVERLLFSILGSVLLTSGLYFFLSNYRDKIEWSFYPVFSLIFSGFALSYCLGPQTPSYNFQSLLLWCCIVFLLLIDLGKRMNFPLRALIYFFIGVLIAILTIVKFPNAITAFVVVLLFLMVSDKYMDRYKRLNIFILILILLSGYFVFDFIFWRGVSNAFSYHIDLFRLVLSNNTYHEPLYILKKYFSSITEVVLWPFKISSVLIVLMMILLVRCSNRLWKVIFTVILISIIINFDFYKGGTDYCASQVKNYFLFMVIVLLGFMYSERSVKSSSNERSFGLTVVKILMFFLPFIASAGTSNPLEIQLICYMPFWMIFFYLTVYDRRIFSPPISKYFIFLILLLASSQTIYAVCVKPYRITGSLLDQSFSFSDEQDFFISKDLMDIYNWSDSVLHSNGYQKNDYLFVYSEHSGLSYLNKGRIPGSHSLWYDHRVKNVNLKIIEDFFSLNPTCKIYLIINKSFPIYDEISKLLNCPEATVINKLGEYVLISGNDSDTLQLIRIKPE